MPDTLFDLLTERARRWPDAVALGSASGLGWESVTSSQLLERTTRLAGELQRILDVFPVGVGVAHADDGGDAPQRPIQRFHCFDSSMNDDFFPVRQSTGNPSCLAMTRSWIS